MPLKHERKTSDLFAGYVYLPYEYNDNTNLFEYLGVIKDLFDNSNCEEVVVCGDFNADPSGRFFSFLNDFCNNESLLVRDMRYFLEIGMPNVFTFESEAHGSTSWLDHVVCSQNVNSRLTCSANSIYPIIFLFPLPLLMRFTKITSRYFLRTCNNVHQE